MVAGESLAWGHSGLGVQDKGEVRPACLEGIHGHPAGLLPRGRSTNMFFYRLLLLDGSVYNISEIFNHLLPHRSETFHCGKLELDPAPIRLEPGQILG